MVSAERGRRRGRIGRGALEMQRDSSCAHMRAQCMRDASHGQNCSKCEDGAPDVIWWFLGAPRGSGSGWRENGLKNLSA